MHQMYEGNKWAFGENWPTIFCVLVAFIIFSISYFLSKNYTWQVVVWCLGFHGLWWNSGIPKVCDKKAVWKGWICWSLKPKTALDASTDASDASLLFNLEPELNPSKNFDCPNPQITTDLTLKEIIETFLCFSSKQFKTENANIIDSSPPKKETN